MYNHHHRHHHHHHHFLLRNHKFVSLAANAPWVPFSSKRHEAANEDAEEDGHDVSWLPFLSGGRVDLAVVALEEQRNAKKPAGRAGNGAIFMKMMTNYGFLKWLFTYLHEFPIDTVDCSYAGCLK